ncbi:MAG: hypothetical protein QOC61_397, partial [Acidobacteriota bacterium]|nr:hypothetical protein [Acidobacteriota bacterium]
HIDEKVKLPITAMWKEANSFVADAEGGEVVVKAEPTFMKELEVV